MKHKLSIPILGALLAILCLGGVLAADAAVPLKWTVETSRVQPVAFDAVHGETLALEATFKSYGKPLELPENAALFYQTNGMGSAWWTAPATVSQTNVVSATLTPSMVPRLGAAPSADRTILSCFLGSTGSIYRAAFTIRFRHGPGATPNVIDAPVPILDLANTTVINPPWPTTNDFVTATNDMQTALKDYVDGEIEGAGALTPQTVTNIVDGKIAAIPKDGVSTNAVSGIITNHVDSGYLCTVAAADAKYLKMSNGSGQSVGWFEGCLLFSGYAGIMLNSFDRIRTAESNLPTYLKSLDWLSGEVPTKTLADYKIGDAYTKTEANAAFAPTSTAVTVSTLATQVSTIGSHLNAEDARFVTTNYNSVTHIPEAYVEVKQTENGASSWIRIWEEMRRWDAWTGDGFDWDGWSGFHAWATNIEMAVGAASPREYAFYDGVTGDVAPDGFFWIGQPRIAICAGASYQRYVIGSSCVWVLESNGMVADVNGTTNGFFRITDTEGNTQFEIVKGDKQTLFANANAMVTTNILGVTHFYTTYAVTNAVTTPTAYVGTSLTNTFYAADSSDCPANVRWTAGVNAYTLEWWPKSNQPTMFVYASYERGGETYINNTAPVKMQTIMIGNKKYSISAVTVGGQTVLGLTEVN